MVHSEIYRGTPITITTYKSGTDNWTARAEFTVSGQRAVVQNDDVTYPSEEHAAAAALQSAVEALDRGRVSTGKW